MREVIRSRHYSYKSEEAHVLNLGPAGVRNRIDTLMFPKNVFGILCGSI